MVAGIDRYFQIVRCFRDEDLRLDRQPEFTQIDLEMSFVVEEDVQDVVEGLMAALWKDVLGIELPRPFPRLTYAEAMGKYGSDKPDLRFDLPLVDLTEVVTRHDGGGVGLLQSAVKTPGGDRQGLAAARRAAPRRCRAPTSTSSRSSPRASAPAAWRARASATAAPGRRAR